MGNTFRTATAADRRGAPLLGAATKRMTGFVAVCTLSLAASGVTAQPPDQPFRPGAGEPTCAGQAEGAACWMELESHSDCYVWNPDLQAGETATWTAGCGGGLASGSGTLKWVSDGGGPDESTGTLRDGKYTGHWVLRLPDGSILEGPYVDGEMNGHWFHRYANGTVSAEGSLVDGERYGRWVTRRPDGKTTTETWVAGQIQ